MSHAKLAPSASKQWLACTASPAYVTALLGAGRIKPDKGSVYAEEGTEAHEWASRLLTGDITIDQVPESFRPHIMEYVRVCAEVEHEAGPGSMRMVEAKVPLFYSPKETGTVDYGFLRMDAGGNVESLHIRDLKYGQGVPVDAEENSQLAIYAMSWIEDLESWWDDIPDHIPVTMGIHQPRYLGDDSLKVWETTVGELRQFCQTISSTAAMIQSAEEGNVEAEDQLQFVPAEDVCRWCLAKEICPARASSTFAGFPVDVMDADLMRNIDLPEVDSIPVETLVSIWSHRKDVQKWYSDVEAYLSELAAAGTPAPGTKLVAGRDGNRAWKDEEAAATKLISYIPRKKLYKETLISPAVAEKELKSQIEKKVLESWMKDLTERPAGKPTLALESDKREAVMASADLFSVLTDKAEE